jgi:peroxiredoxin
MPTGIWLYSYLALWALLMTTSLLLVAVIRQVRDLHSYWGENDPAWGLPLGAPAPALPKEDLFGRPVTLGAERGKKTVLLFLSRGCPGCRAAMTEMPVLATREDMILVLVVSGKPLDARLFLATFRREIGFPHVPALADPDSKLTQQYNARAVPYVVVVDEDGRIGAQGAVPLDQLGSLFHQADELRQRRLTGADGPVAGEVLVEADDRVSEPAAA